MSIDLDIKNFAWVFMDLRDLPVHELMRLARQAAEFHSLELPEFESKEGARKFIVAARLQTVRQPRKEPRQPRGKETQARRRAPRKVPKRNPAVNAIFDDFPPLEPGTDIGAVKFNG